MPGVIGEVHFRCCQERCHAGDEARDALREIVILGLQISVEAGFMKFGCRVAWAHGFLGVVQLMTMGTAGIDLGGFRPAP